MLKTIRNIHLPIIILTIIYLIFSFSTYKMYGVTTDEPLEYQSTEKLLKFYEKGVLRVFFDKELNANPEERHEPLSSLYYRGHLLLHSYLYSAKDFFELHLLNILLALPLFIISYYVFLQFFDKWYFAIFAPFFLLIDPRITGHIPANPKDFPFASVVLIYVLLLSLFGIRKYTIAKNIILGILLGLVLAIRPIGISVFVSIFLVYVFISLKNITFKKLNLKDKTFEPFKNVIFNFLIQGLVAFLFLSLTWPYFAQNTIPGFFNFLFYGASFPDWSGSVLFDGQYISYNNIPWNYLFVWLFISTPTLHIFLVTLSIFLFKKIIKVPLIYNILLIVFLNFIVYLIFTPLIYNGIRHYLFLTSLITLYCAYIFVFLLKDFSLMVKENKSFKEMKYSLALFIFTLFLILSLLKDNVTLFPYQSIYFNELNGGVRNLGRSFDTDYWHQSRLEAANWVVKNLNTYGEKIYVCNLSDIIKYYQPRIEIVKDKDDATISICDPRREIEREIDGEIIQSVLREGIPLTNIRRLN